MRATINVIIVLLINGLHAGLGKQDGCVREGGCIAGSSLGTAVVSDLCECHTLCTFSGDCFFYSFNMDSKECEQFERCFTVDQDLDNFLTGYGACAPPQCSDDPCVQPDLKYLTSSTVELDESDLCSCYESCNTDAQCIFYTFDAENMKCYLSGVGGGEVTPCQSCISGWFLCDPNGC